MDSIKYKKYEVRAASQQLAESGEWTLRAVISFHKENETAEKIVSTANTFKTEEEANHHSLEFGRRVIDGLVPGCGVADL